MFKKATVQSLGGVVKSEDDVTIVSVEEVSVSGRRRLNEQTALEIDYDLAVAVEDEDASEDGTFADLQTAMAASEAGFAEALEEESTAEGSSAFDGTTAVRLWHSVPPQRAAALAWRLTACSRPPPPT